jgi:hypothetical protein
MANEVRRTIRTLNLSATQLKAMTKAQGSEWSDELINDYLTIVANFISVANRVDGVIEQVDTNEANIETNRLDSIVVTNKTEVNQLAIIVVTEDLQSHVASYSEHGVAGINVGTENFAESLVAGVVLLAGFISDAVESAAEVTIGDVGTAPVAYSKAYADEQTAMINDIKSKHNALLSDLNLVVAQLNALLLSLVTSKQMAAS